MLLIIAIPALDLSLGLPDDSTNPEETTERRSYDLLAGAFGPGFTGPLTVVVDSTGQENPQEIAAQAVEVLQDFDNVAAVSQPALNATGDVAVITVTPSTSPASQETKDLVSALRAEADAIRDETGINAMVTGNTAINIDTSDKLSAALPVFLILVVGLALLLADRGVPLDRRPGKAVVGFLLTMRGRAGARRLDLPKG